MTDPPPAPAPPNSEPPPSDALVRNLDTIYVLSFFIQLGVMIATVVALIGWAEGRGVDWRLWVWIGAALCFGACHLAQRWIQRWFRRHRPILRSSEVNSDG